MSAKENLGDYYADSAYTPTKRQQWEAANPERDTIIGSRLTWNRRTQDNGTNEEYGYNNIAISQNWEAQREEKNLVGDDIFKNMNVRYDHQCIMPPNYKARAGFFYTTTAICKGGGIFQFFFYFFLCRFCSSPLFLTVTIRGLGKLQKD